MNQQELLWKYAEGSCSAAEVALIEKQLADDPTLQQELDSILEVQSVLGGMEADKPSMRFTQNVLDALPDIYQIGVTEPLVKPIWKKVFWLLLATLAVGVCLVPRTSQPNGFDLTSYIGQVAENVSKVVGQVPSLVVQYFVLTLLSIGLLMLMDKLFLKKVRGIFLV